MGEAELYKIALTGATKVTVGTIISVFLFAPISLSAIKRAEVALTKATAFLAEVNLHILFSNLLTSGPDDETQLSFKVLTTD